MLQKQINGFVRIVLNSPNSPQNWHMNNGLLIIKNIRAYMFLLVHINDQAKN
jgi:hypothetical protein